MRAFFQPNRPGFGRFTRRSALTWLTLTMFYVGGLLFFLLAILLVWVFVVSMRRRRAYERGEYDPND